MSEEIDGGVQVNADFLSDLRDMLTHEMALVGYAVDPGWDIHRLSLVYMNLLRRRVEEAPRRVHKSTQLLANPRLAAHGAAVSGIQAALEAGIDVNLFLSKKLLDAQYNDGLLNDWGIHHFHLGAPASGGALFAGRTGDLLFAMLTGDCAYFIDIFDHAAFEEVQLVEVLHSNWPALIAPYKFKGTIRMKWSATGEDLKQLRKAGITTFTTLSDGSVYGPMGGGIALSAVNARAAAEATELVQLVRRVERGIRRNASAIRDALTTATGQTLPSFDLRLIDLGGRMGVEERQSGQVWMVTPDLLEPAP